MYVRFNCIYAVCRLIINVSRLELVVDIFLAFFYATFLSSTGIKEGKNQLLITSSDGNLLVIYFHSGNGVGRYFIFRNNKGTMYPNEIAFGKHFFNFTQLKLG